MALEEPDTSVVLVLWNEEAHNRHFTESMRCADELIVSFRQRSHAAVVIHCEDLARSYSQEVTAWFGQQEDLAMTRAVAPMTLARWLLGPHNV